jgi:hypothetical protein
MRIFIFLLILIPSILSAQVMPKQSAGISLMPDYGAGVNYSRYFGHVGVYGSYAHTIMGFSTRRFDSSQKISTGLIYLIFDNSTKYPFCFLAGTSYNTYKDVNPFYAKDKHTTQPFDLQLGVSSMIDLFNVGFRYDVMKHEASVDFSMNFGKQVIRHKNRR